MATYDSYDTVEVPVRRHKHHHHHRDRDRDRDDDPNQPQYVETRETYVRGPALVPDPPYGSRQTELIRRPGREDSDMSVEEIQRQFPPPGAVAAGAGALGAGAGYLAARDMYRDDRYYGGGGQLARSRSVDGRSQYDYDDRREERRGRKTIVKEEVVEPRRRSLSRNQKILAGVAGAALAVGGKELFDRRKYKGQPHDRNFLATAAVGAAGAFAGYEGAEFVAHRFGGKEEKKVKDKTYMTYQGRDGEVAEYYSSDDDEREKPKRRKSFVEGALAAAGVGAAAKAVGDRNRDRDDRSDRRSRRGSDDDYDDRRSRRSRSRSKNKGAAKFQQAAKAALLAGATEAFRIRNEPGGLSGAKTRRILTAAIGAAGIDAAADRDPDKHSKRHILEAVIGGLAGNRLINGSSKNLEADEHGRSRSRSRGGSAVGTGLAGLATAGIGALVGKQLLDRSRSRDRGDDRDRGRRYDSDDESPPRRSRSKSIGDVARKGLAALGIGEAADSGRDRDRRDRDRDRDYVEEDTTVRKSRRRRDSYDDDDRYDDRYDNRSRGDRYDDDRYDTRSNNGRRRDGERNKRIAEGKQSDSDTDSLGSSSGDEKKVRKMKGKQFLTAGLATVATIHAAHNVYQSIQKREARHKAVEEGTLSPEEANKLKAKARLQDIASIGIAALGIKGAISEWKEMKEMRGECKELEEEKEKRHKKRLERQKRLKDGDSVSQDSNTAVSRSRDRRQSIQRRRSNSVPDVMYAGGRYPAQSGPTYFDDNPYGSGPLPAPPVGYNYANGYTNGYTNAYGYAR